MLPTNLFIFQILFLQAINYFKHKSWVRADGSNSETELTPLEIRNFMLSAYVKNKVVDNWQNTDILKNSYDLEYVPIAYFDGRLFDVDSLKTKLSNKIVKFWTWNTDENANRFQEILEEHSKEILFNYDETSYIETDFSVYIKKSAWIAIINSIKNNTDYQVTGISLRVSGEDDVWLLQLFLSNERQYLNIYWPQRELNGTRMVDLIAETSYSYSEIHKDVFMYTIEHLKSAIDDNNSKTLKIDDKLNLHIDESPTMFLYESTEIPDFQFFDKFNIKIKLFDEQNLKEKIVEHFECKPSVLIEFNRTNTDSRSYIDLQISKYENYETSELYFVEDANYDISYKNIDFDNSTITSQKKSAELYIILETPKTKPVLKIGFMKITDILFYEPEAYKALENSISKIIFLPYEGENRAITIDKDAFQINNDDSSFTITLDHGIFSTNDLLPINSILKNGNGVFKIYVLCNNYILIESTFCFYNNKMWSLSTNTLIEHLSTLGFQNDVKRPPSSEESPPTEEDDIPLTNLHKKGDIDPSQEGTISSKAKSNISSTTSQEENVSSESKLQNEEVCLVLNVNVDSLTNTQLQGQNNTNFKTSYDTTKNKNNSKPEDIPTSSENTSENEEAELGSTTILISSALVGGVGLGGLFAYMYFF